MADHPAVTFLLAAHERAATLAKAATKGPWTVDDERYPEEIHGLHGADVVTGSRRAGEASVFDSDADALFIAANHPGTVLLRVLAERDILAEHAPDDDRWPDCSRCGGETREIEVGGGMIVRAKESVPFPCRTVLGLAKAWGWEETT